MEEGARVASCRCGQLKATCVGEPVRVSVCHCLECQKRSGSAFAAQARWAEQNVVISGGFKTWSRVADSGGRCEYRFCPDCGSNVTYSNAAWPELVAVPLGAFADPHFPPPTFSVYEHRKHEWVAVLGDAVEHSSTPSSLRAPGLLPQRGRNSSAPKAANQNDGELARDLIGVVEEIIERRGAEEAQVLFDSQIDPAKAAIANVLQPGMIAPDFTLMDSSACPVQLSSILADTRAVLVFYRGLWCPFCKLQLRAMARRLPEFSAAGAKVLAISPAAPAGEDENSMLPFPVLWDPKNVVARRYGLLFKVSPAAEALLRKRHIDLDLISNGAGWELPIPATFVVDQDGSIISTFADADYRSRPEPDDILRALV